METVKINTSQHIDIDYPVAGLGERVGAYLIDYGLFLAIYLLAIFTYAAIGTSVSLSPIFYTVLLIIYAVCYVFYDLVCEIAFNGQSLGKKLLKIRVVSLDGAQPSIGQYFIRWIFRIIDFTLTLDLLGFICVAVGEKKQRIGDMVAGTTVIRTTPAVKMEHIAFQPVTDDYMPIFNEVAVLSDGDIELVHEVIRTYYQTYNPQLVYQMAEKVSQHLGIQPQEGMNEMQFLKTVAADYVQITSRVV